MKRLVRIASVCISVTIVSGAAAASAETTRYGLLCDASAGVALGSGRFVVADDELNILRIYQTGTEAPVERIPIFDFLGTESDKESDLEGAALVKDRVYWISSHSRNKSGEVKPRRYRFFATEWPAVEPIGKPYRDLLSDMLEAPSLSALPLKAGSELAPEEEGGLNIEGLASTPDGGLLIGFRNPVPEGVAIIVPLTNPEAVIDGKKAEFGKPEMLDLGGLGIRSIERMDSGYLILAGSTDDAGDFRLYRWSGPMEPSSAEETSLSVVEDVDFRDMRPEVVFDIGANSIRILSDDGSVEHDGVECKALPEANRSFESLDIMLPPD